MRTAMLILVFIITGTDIRPILDIREHHHHRHHREACPGALYFIRHDSPMPAHLQGKRPLCRIGAHDFYR